MKAFTREWYALVSTRSNAKEALEKFDLRKGLDEDAQMAAVEAWLTWGEVTRAAKLTYVKEEVDGVLVVTLSSGEIYREDEPL